MQAFRWEHEDYWWEMLRLDELGLPASWNIVLPDKVMHFLMVFLLGWLLSRWGGKILGPLCAWVVMMGAWEIIWDGCFRYGASWRDMIANTLGGLAIWWLLRSREKVGQTGPIPPREKRA
jgi:hypothetical protein